MTQQKCVEIEIGVSYVASQLLLSWIINEKKLASTVVLNSVVFTLFELCNLCLILPCGELQTVILPFLATKKYLMRSWIFQRKHGYEIHWHERLRWTTLQRIDWDKLQRCPFGDSMPCYPLLGRLQAGVEAELGAAARVQRQKALPLPAFCCFVGKPAKWKNYLQVLDMVLNQFWGSGSIILGKNAGPDLRIQWPELVKILLVEKWGVW